MGIYDRDYIRNEPSRSPLAGWSGVWIMIAINAAVFVLDLFSPEGAFGYHWLDNHMALRADLLSHPWQFWTLLTYGFAHDPHTVEHIGFNMFGLWMFGMDVEAVYGRERFIRLYLALVVCSGLVWLALEVITKHPQDSAIGASGAVVGIIAVYVMNFPNRILLLFFVLPIPAWLFGIGFALFDIFETVHPTDHVAHAAHVAGAAFGVIFARTGWYLGCNLPTRWPKWAKFGGPKLRVRSEHDEPQSQRDVQKRVDEILEKISREGEASLTPQERRELEELSRRFRHGK